MTTSPEERIKLILQLVGDSQPPCPQSAFHQPTELRQECESLAVDLPRPQLGSRLRFLGRLYVFIRRVGFVLFVKWFLMPVINHQETVNRELKQLLSESIADQQTLRSTVDIERSSVQSRLNEFASNIFAGIEAKLKSVEALSSSRHAVTMARTSTLEDKITSHMAQLQAQLTTTATTIAYLQDALNEVSEAVEHLRSDISAKADHAPEATSVGGQIQRLNDLVRVLTGLLGYLQPIVTKANVATAHDPDGDNTLPPSHMALTSEFLAPVDTIKEGYRQYLPFIESDDLVVDLGCGRGAMLELLRDSGISSVIGVDLDPACVALGKGLGYQVELEDVMTFLSRYVSQLDVVFAGHLIEHLSPTTRVHFIQRVFDALRKGGRFIIETPNTSSVYVLTNVYYLDPTHQQPLHPEAYRILFEQTGFRTLRSYLSSPIPTQSVTADDYYNYSWIGVK